VIDLDSVVSMTVINNSLFEESKKILLPFSYHWKSCRSLIGSLIHSHGMIYRYELKLWKDIFCLMKKTNRYLRYKTNMWINKFVVEKRLKHKIQNTSVQRICRNTRPKRKIILAYLKLLKDGIRWMSSLNLPFLRRQNASLRSRNWLFHSEWG
jgi:hypothetical protein